MRTSEQFPIGFWNYVPIEHQGIEAVKDWADAGMTVAMGPMFGPAPEHIRKMTAILDAAHEQGIKVIVCHAHALASHLTTVGPEQYRRDCQKAVEQFGEHPATFGFWVGDEPDTKSFADNCLAYRIQKETAPHLSPLLNLLAKQPDSPPHVGYDDYSEYLDAYVAATQPDFLGYDCYTQMFKGTTGWDIYFENLRLTHAAAQRHGLPWWTTLLSVGHWCYRRPTEDDLRWQLSTAVAHGAKGLMWFFFYMREPRENYRLSPIDEHYQRSRSYEGFSRVNRSFLKTIAPVMRELTLQRISHVGQAWGGVPLFDGSGLVCRARSGFNNPPLIVSEFAHADGSQYVMVVNNSTQDDTQAELWIRGRRPTAYHAHWLAKEQVLPGSKLNVREDHCVLKPWLSPGQMELFRIEDQAG